MTSVDAPVPARDLRPWFLLGAFLAATLLVTGLWRLAVLRDERTRVAILPFSSATATSPASIEGLTDDLIARAGMLAPGKLGVVGRASVMRFRGQGKAITEIARELDAQFVLEGSIAAGDRVDARLIRASDQKQVWSATVAFAEAVPKILGGLGEAIGRGAAVPPAPAIRDAKALAAFEDARFVANRGSFAAAADGFRASLRIEESAAANTALAGALIAQAATAEKPASLYAPAIAAARKALALHESDPEAHAALANGLFWFEWKWTEAERHFRRALALNPSCAKAHHDFAWLLVAAGRTLEGLRELDLALSLDPLSAAVNAGAGWMLQQARRYPESEAQARRALALDPGSADVEACLARALVMQGKTKEPPLDPEHAGLFDQARQYVRQAEREKAVGSLERAVEEHNAIALLLKSEQLFDWLHGEKRYQALVKRVGIP